MDFANRLASQLPYVRRYARALTGDQQTGDHYVRLSLETLADGDEMLTEDVDPRVALYRHFHIIWSSSGALLETRSDAEGREQDRPQVLMRLTPPSRQAFLLTAVEGFTLEETADILETSNQQVMNLIATAQREISETLATEVLIIEDEPLIAADLEEIVEDMGHTVIGVARTRTEANALVAKRMPRLILADVNLADGSSGIDAVKDIVAGRYVPVVYITAHPEALLSGEGKEPTFLITKPFQVEMVRAAVGQALFFFPASEAVAA